MTTTNPVTRTNYILIDLENVQPDNLALLMEHDFKVMVFVGASQSKITFDMAVALQSLGKRAEYIKISGNGPNALDFHIAFYIGHIAAIFPNSYFHIISKDTGFDPLIKHLKQNKIFVQRHGDISRIPLLKILTPKNLAEKVMVITKFLHTRGQAKPRTITTLSNSINNYFKNALTPQQINELINQLSKLGYIREENKKIIYHLPEKMACEPA